MLGDLIFIWVRISNYTVFLFVWVSTALLADEFLFGLSQNFTNVLGFNFLFGQFLIVGTFEGAFEIHTFAKSFSGHEALFRSEVLQAVVNLIHLPLGLDFLHPVLVVLELGRGQVFLFEFNWLLFGLWSGLTIID